MDIERINKIQEKSASDARNLGIILTYVMIAVLIGIIKLCSIDWVSVEIGYGPLLFLGLLALTGLGGDSSGI